MLAPLNIPNIISVNPAFVVNLRLSGESESRIFISTGKSRKSGTFSTTFQHAGVKNDVKVSSTGSKPFSQNTPASAVKPDLNSAGKTRLILEFNPSLEMTISVLGKPVPDEVTLNNSKYRRPLTLVISLGQSVLMIHLALQVPTLMSLLKLRSLVSLET